MPGFQPSTGTVATLMGDEPRRGRRHDAPRRERERERPQQQAPASRHEKPKPPADPIFSKPYEPSPTQAPQASEAKPEANQGKRKRPQVAALLGGKR